MPRYTQPRRTWHYLNEFKVKAVQLSLLDGVQVQEVAATLDIHPFMLSRWRKEYREGSNKCILHCGKADYSTDWNKPGFLNSF